MESSPRETITIIEPERADTGLRRLLNKRIWIPFAVAFVAGMLVHFTIYSNGLVNPDGLWNSEYSLASSWEVSLGRWALYLVDLLHAGVNSSTLTAFFTVLYMALAGTLVASLFQVKSMAKAIAIATVLTCSPMVSMFITYPYCGDAYALSILLGVVSIYAIHAFPGRFKGPAISALCITLLTGLYQSSLGVMLAVAIGYLLLRVVREPSGIKGIGKDALRLLISAVIGIVLYYALTQLAIRAWGISLADYKGAGGVSIGNILQNIPTGIRQAYSNFHAFFLKDWIAKNPYLTPYVYWALAGFALVSLIVHFVTTQPKRPSVMILCVILLIVLPVCCNIINLVVPGTDLYLLMVGGMMMIIPLLIALTDIDSENKDRKKGVALVQKILSKCGTVIAFVLVWVFILSCQTDASVMLTSKNQIVPLANRIWQQVESNEEYTSGGTPLLIAGHPQDGSYPNPSRLFDKANVYATWGTVWKGYDGNIQTWAQALRQYLGVTYQGASADQFREISISEDFQQMPLYPAAGSVQMIDEVLVVKISDTTGWAD